MPKVSSSLVVLFCSNFHQCNLLSHLFHLLCLIFSVQRIVLLYQRSNGKGCSQRSRSCARHRIGRRISCGRHEHRRRWPPSSLYGRSRSAVCQQQGMWHRFSFYWILMYLIEFTIIMMPIFSDRSVLILMEWIILKLPPPWSIFEGFLFFIYPFLV